MAQPTIATAGPAINSQGQLWRHQGGTTASIFCLDIIIFILKIGTTCETTQGGNIKLEASRILIDPCPLEGIEVATK